MEQLLEWMEIIEDTRQHRKVRHSIKDKETRNHLIYDVKSGYIKIECLHQGWQTSGSI